MLSADEAGAIKMPTVLSDKSLGHSHKTMKLNANNRGVSKDTQRLQNPRWKSFAASAVSRIVLQERNKT